MEAHLNEFISASGFTSLIMTLVVILSAGGLCAAMAARGPLARKGKGTTTSNHKAECNEDDPLNKNLNQRIYLNGLKGDPFGQTSQVLKTTLQTKFARFVGAQSKAVTIVPTGAHQPSKEAAIALQNHPSFDVFLSGKVEGQKIELYLSSPTINAENLKVVSPFDDLPINEASAEPLVKTIIPLKPNKPTPQTTKKSVYSYHCYEFPLISLKGLTCQLPGAQKDLLHCAVIGNLRRGLKISKHGLSVKLLNNRAQRLDQAAPGLKQTQPILYQEMTLVCAWCYMMVGLLSKNKPALTRALTLYKKSDEFHERAFKDFERATMLANQTECARALALLSKPHSKEHRAHYQSAIETASRAMIYFERCNHKSGWAKASLNLALGFGALVDTPLKEAGNEDSAYKIDPTNIYDQPSVENNLKTAIAHLQKSAVSNGDEAALSAAYYAKAHIIKSTAKQHMGAQQWERAQNSFLAALSHSQNHELWFAPNSQDIHFELAQLYLQWGTDHGQQELLEKAIHHFSIVKEDKHFSHFTNRNDTALAIAQCTLTLSGVTNSSLLHKSAREQLNTLKDQQKYKSCNELLDRALAVASARLALSEHDNQEARRAVTQISALIGQKTNSFPSKDVLLRLRARLREMLYQLEGDDRALDRAINDQRDLMSEANANMNELRWAVEAGDLAGLLVQRRAKGKDNQTDLQEANNLLHKSIAICETHQTPTFHAQGEYIPHIKASLYKTQACILEGLGRADKNLAKLNEALGAYEKILTLRPREQNDTDRAKVLYYIGQIQMDKSEHFGQHEGLERAANCFAQSYDIYLESQQKDQANRMRQFMENAQAALLVYGEPINKTAKNQTTNQSVQTMS